MTRTADELAVEHGTLARDGDGWYTAALAACSILRRARGSRDSRDNDDAKVSIPRYAEKSGIGEDTLQRILQAWDGQAEKGLVPLAETLKPSDLPRVVGLLPNEAEHPWKDAYRGLGRNGPDAARERMLKDPEALVAKMTPDQRVAVIEHAIDDGGIRERMAAERAVQRAAERQRPEYEETGRRMEQIKREDREEDRKPGFLRWMNVSGCINKARQAIKDAIDLTHGAEPFSEEHKESIQRDIVRLRETVDFLNLVITGEADIDWDAELQKMGME